MRYSLTQVPLTVSPFLSCPRSGITVSPQPAKSHSLQAIRFQHNTHSFPQRRQPIPRPFNHLRTLLPLTTSFFQPTPPRPPRTRVSPAFSFPFNNLPPLCPLQKSQIICNQANPASLCKTPGVGGGPAFDIPTFRPECLPR